MALGTAVVVFGWLTSSGVLWWNTAAISAAQERKAALQTEVAEMQANRDGWVKAGMLAKLDRCGPKSRPCVRVDESAGAFGDQGHSDYRVIQGY
jgi:hypothetical protein